MSIAFLNLPIEFYSPVTGGAIATIIAEMARVLEARGEEVTVLSRLDRGPVHPCGRVVALGPCGREDLNVFQRKISHWRGRRQAWDWPFFDCYRRAVTAAVRSLPRPPEMLILFNDLLSPVFLRELLPHTKICVWLQNEQRTRQPDLTASSAATTVWFTCSDYIRDWTIREHGLDPARVFTLPSGVNTGQFFPREDFEAPLHERRTLFVGRLDPNKGPDLALDAVATLRREGLPLTMTVVGGKWFYRQRGEEADPYLQLIAGKIAATQGMGMGHVPRDRIGEIFREHDVVFVLSRSQEPFGLVVLEAMASGCAVIASNRGGLPQACGGAALLVDPDRPEEIASALRRLIADPAEMARVKRESLARASAARWEETMSLLLAHLPGEFAAA